MALLFETHAHGKLLLTGEYFVLDGATALAMPVRFGQSLRVEAGDQAGQLVWHSQDEQGDDWFSAVFDLKKLEHRAIERCENGCDTCLDTPCLPRAKRSFFA